MRFMWGNVTVDTPDAYGGAAVTSKNLYRKTGLASFTEVAGAATFNANPGDTYEVIFGIGASDDDDEPFGCKVSWTCPCQAYPTLSAAEKCTLPNGKTGIVDDTAAGTSLTSSLFDPDDGNAITSSDTIDIDAAQMKNIRWVFSGVYEEAYGNPWTNDNVVTISYNTSAYDDVKLTDQSGSTFPTTETPNHYSAVAGNAAKSYKVPAVLSNTELTYYIVVDADDTIDPGANADNNITVYMYDGNHFINNDVSPAAISSGVQDEDAAQVGGSTDFTDTINVYNG